MGTGGAALPQASSSAATNPGPMESSQHDKFPEGNEADDDSLPSFEEPTTGGADPLSKPGCAQVSASGIETMAQEVWIHSDEYPELSSSTA
eukprot:11633468-Karenia_brevis.AAC.1